MNDDLTQMELQFIEDFSLLMIQDRFPRLAGRILCLLLLKDPEPLSAPQIGALLKASKGSVSTLLRQLLAAGLIEQKAIPGERREFYGSGNLVIDKLFVAMQMLAKAYVLLIDKAEADLALAGKTLSPGLKRLRWAEEGMLEALPVLQRQLNERIAARQKQAQRVPDADSSAESKSDNVTAAQSGERFQW